MIPINFNELQNFEMIKDKGVICCGDSLNLLKSISDNSIEACITDPPYFIDGMGSNWNVDELNANHSNRVTALPAGMKFDVQQGRDLQEFMEKISKEVYRILKPGGFYLCFSQGRLYHRMAIALENCNFEIRDLLIWERNGQPKAFSMDHLVNKLNCTEVEKQNILNIIGNRKTPQVRCISEPIVVAQKPKEGTFIDNYLKYGVGLIDTSVQINSETVTTILKVPRPNKQEWNQHSHLTMKPIELIQYLIKIYTKENDIILDPFLGSGTTAIACLNTKRNFIGFELNSQYYEESIKRIKNHFMKVNNRLF